MKKFGQALINIGCGAASITFLLLMVGSMITGKHPAQGSLADQLFVPSLFGGIALALVGWAIKSADKD